MTHDLPELPSLPLGQYRHYKGGAYEVLGVVRHSESLEPLVLYRPLHHDTGCWVRPFSMFLEPVEHEGQTQPRFRPVASGPVARREAAPSVRPAPPAPTAQHLPQAHTGAMAIPHAHPGQAVDVQPLGPCLEQEKTVALFKSADLEVMRLVLLAGHSVPPHRVPGDITVQCIEGSIDVTVDGRSHVLKAGQLLFLLGGVSHGVTALQDASALVSVALRK